MLHSGIVLEHLSNYKRTYAFFHSKTVQQLTPQMVVYCLRVFGDRIVNREFWSPHLPAIKLSYFYANNPVSDDDVKKRHLGCCVISIRSRTLM